MPQPITQKPSQVFHCRKWQHIFDSNIVPASNDGTMKHGFSWCSTRSTPLTCCAKRRSLQTVSIYGHTSLTRHQVHKIRSRSLYFTSLYSSTV